MPEKFEKCIICGKSKITRAQQASPCCSSCANIRRKEERNKQYFSCIDCGVPKTTYHQQRSPRCNACSGLHKHTHEEYFSACIDCGEPFKRAKIYPRCKKCAYDYLRKNEFFDTCQRCGRPKKHTHSQLCVSCAHSDSAKRQIRKVKEKPEKKPRPKPKTIKAPNKHRYEVVYSICQQCGKEKAATDRPLCHSCSGVKAQAECGHTFRTVYDHCQQCGKKKPKNDRELCLACAGIKRMTEMYPNTDRKYPYGWSENYRESIRTRDHHKCVLCGKSEQENGRKLDVHHIDYCKNHIENPDNLISLCMICHQKTNWHRSYWQTFFAMQKRQHLQDWQHRAIMSSDSWNYMS